MPTLWLVQSTADGVANPGNCPGLGCRLRDAIVGSTSGDTIDFAVTGAITLTQGVLTISSDDITISGPGAVALTIDGNNSSRIFNVFGSTVSISGLTLAHGLVNDANSGPNDIGGAAIESRFSSHLTLDQMVISQNTVNCASPCSDNGVNGAGGAIASLTDSSLVITNSVISSNVASLYGGGIYFNALNATSGNDLTLTDVTLTGNQVTGTTIGDGGALAVAFGHAASLSGVVMSGNQAGTNGGGLSASAAPISINRSTLTSNHTLGTDVQDGGGAISISFPGSLVLANSTLSGNSSAAGGGGLLNLDGSVLAYNSTFQGNTAAVGGGIEHTSGALLLINDTIAANSATGGHGGGLSVDGGSLDLKNTILSGSTGSDCRSTATTWTANLDNLIRANDGVDPCNSPAVSLDPKLAPLGNYGGPTNTMAVLPGSAAIDAADNTTCADLSTVNNLDQRGRPRPLDGDHNGISICDIGSFEAPLFADVPVPGKEWMEPWVDAFYLAGITTGCGGAPLIYCPENNVTRAEMAVFLLRAVHGIGYAPPAASHFFSDMPVLGKEWMEPWVDEFYREGLTTGCGSNPLIYCPENNVTRAEMAVFILRAVHGGAYSPPTTSGIFADMPVPGKEWMESWVDEFYNEGITTGCGTNPLIYCPSSDVTRAEMAVFIDRAYHFYP